jgi:membrane associated rhomboid family serine protease
MTDDATERPRAGGLLAPVLPVLAMLGVMWGQEVVDTVLDGRLDRFGIRPRQLDGLDGIVLAPFLHGGFGHLIANTFPFLIMGGAICLGSVRRFVHVTLVVAVIGGVGTWLTGPERSVHIGASGLVFGYLTYLISRGFFARKVSYILGGLLTFMVYGGVLWGLLPRPGISWQGHLFGAAGGVAAAWIIHGQQPDDADLPA